MKTNTSRRSYAMVAEVARFLRVEPRDVRTWLRTDGLPETRVPTRTKTVPRIYLPDLHRWLIERTNNQGPALREYSEFAAEFEETRKLPRKGVDSDIEQQPETNELK